MLKAIAAIIFVLWLIGFILHLAGGLIHLLLVIALVVLLMDFFTNRHSAV